MQRGLRLLTLSVVLVLLLANFVDLAAVASLGSAVALAIIGILLLAVLLDLGWTRLRERRTGA